MVKRKQKISTKYHADSAGEFEPGSKGKVLKNLQHIISLRELENAELLAYIEAEKKLIQRINSGTKFTTQKINEIHRIFLGKTYPWAGTYRTVNISKGRFLFATAMAIPSAMNDFDKTTLSKNTPCNGETIGIVARQIAEVHVEFLLIHPYREGNGRTARLLATMMSYQAGYPGIDFGFIGSRGKEFERYITAIHQGVSRRYDLMKTIIIKALKRAGQSTRGV